VPRPGGRAQVSDRDPLAGKSVTLILTRNRQTVAICDYSQRTAWTLFGLGDKPGYQVLAAGKFGESVPLPAPLGFSIPTTEWPS